uniref:Putative ovule protein n=1 Tax=Solanum chacoense TaxID=4108 RepID=A0A0V0GZY0_SOLCH
MEILHVISYLPKNLGQNSRRYYYFFCFLSERKDNTRVLFLLFVLLTFLVRFKKNVSFLFGNSFILTFYMVCLRSQD